MCSLGLLIVINAECTTADVLFSKLLVIVGMAYK